MLMQRIEAKYDGKPGEGGSFKKQRDCVHFSFSLIYFLSSLTYSSFSCLWPQATLPSWYIGARLLLRGIV